MGGIRLVYIDSLSLFFLDGPAFFAYAFAKACQIETSFLADIVRDPRSR